MVELLLLTGLPGTGKTTLADYLAAEHHYHHFDRELFGSWPRWQRSWWNRHLPSFIWMMHWWYGKIVISWGFSPHRDLKIITKLSDLGFTLFWFDGDRKLAHQYYTQRKRGDQASFFAQLKEVDTLDLKTLPVKLLNPFTSQGKFKSAAQQVREIMQQATQ